MNTTAPRFVGEFPSNLDETRARLLDFADFLDSLKLTKFNHSKWCRPDHTCKTEACGAGWAALLYSENTKNIINLVYKKQRLQTEEHEMYMKLCKLDRKTKAYKALQKQRTKKLRAINRINVNEKTLQWEYTGKRVLGLDSDTAYALFIPGSGFWDAQHFKNEKKRASGHESISSRQFALAVRFLAHTPCCKFVDLKTNEALDFHDVDNKYPSYNPRAYKKYIKEHPITPNV